MSAFEQLVGVLGPSRLAALLLERDPVDVQAIYANLSLDLRESIAQVILSMEPTLHVIRHLASVAAPGSFDGLARWSRHAEPEIRRGVLSAIERIIFGTPSLGPAVMRLFDTRPNRDSETDIWARILGTVGSQAALDRLRALPGAAAEDELARHAAPELLGVRNSAGDRAALTVGLNARESGAPLHLDEVKALVDAKKFALLWQLMGSGQVLPSSYSYISDHLTTAETKSQRRFARRIATRILEA